MGFPLYSFSVLYFFFLFSLSVSLPVIVECLLHTMGTRRKQMWPWLMGLTVQGLWLGEKGKTHRQ